MKLSNAQIEAVAQEIINIKTTEINELYEKTVEKAVKKEYDDYLKSDFAKQVGIIEAINSNIIVFVDLSEKAFTDDSYNSRIKISTDSYNSRIKISTINKSIYERLCFVYKNSLTKNLSKDKVRHLITLNTIGAKDLQDLIDTVKSKL